MNSTLALAKADYEKEVGYFLGYGRGAGDGDSEWTADQQIIITADVKSGLRRWYYCGHPWSFLKPFAAIAIPEGATTVELPDDFGGIDGGTTANLTNSSNSFLARLQFKNPGKVLQALSEATAATGPTRIISIRPVKALKPGKMQTQELYFFPEADQDYTLTFPYFVTPNYLLDHTPYAYGGVEHHEAILESCLAVAEARRDNAMNVHSAEFKRLLQLSVEIDRRKQPTNLGQNRDTSDGVGFDQWNGHGWQATGGVTINDVYYE